jgi:diguanylate cyclase (GGDEF)-like protein
MTSNRRAPLSASHWPGTSSDDATATLLARLHEAERSCRELEAHLAEQAAAKAELITSLERRHLVTVQLLHIQQAIARRQPLQGVMEEIAQGVSQALDADVVGLRIIDEANPGVATLRSYLGLSLDYEISAPIDEGVGGLAMAEDRLVVIEGYAGHSCSMPAAVGAGICSAMAAPVHRDGRVAGALLIGSRHDVRFSEHERAAALSFAEVTSLALNDDAACRAMADAVTDAEHRAEHDPLTDLPNRARVLEGLEEALARARRTGEEVTILFVDLDRFKRVNDSFGHSVGDEVLVRVAERLHTAARDVDLVGRLSGDEFVVVCEGLEEEQALRVASRLREAVAQPLPLYGRETVITASVGLRRTTGDAPAEQILQDADVAMYRAKESGRARTERFDPQMRTGILDRLELERGLRHAADRGELRLEAQPIADAEDLRLVGAEVLVRWQHPERGLLMPDAFIGVAEEAGFIVAIDSWVLHEACRRLASWRADVPEAAGLRVNVNVSALRFTDSAFVPSVRSAIAEAGIPADCLALEITESVLMAETKSSAATLHALRDLGCRLVIDDFGTGYSSLAYLQRLPVDEVKIDRSFVRDVAVDPGAGVLVRAIASLAGELGLDVVAEGVETVEQLDFVRGIGCNLLQGYLLGRPADADIRPVLTWEDAPRDRLPR